MDLPSNAVRCSLTIFEYSGRQKGARELAEWLSLSPHLRIVMFRRAFTPLRAATRSYATSASEIASGSGKAFLEERAHVQQHAAGSAELWRKIT